MTENINLLLTQSQELDLLSDQVVGSVMNLLEMDNNPNQQQFRMDQLIQHQERYNIIYETDQFPNHFNNQNNNTNENNCNEMMPYSILMSPQVPPAPPPPTLPPVPQFISNEEFPGEFDFDVCIDPHYPSKSPWVYSQVLNKIFIAVSSPFPVDFRWNTSLPNFFVRATPLYSLAQYSQDLVLRCIPHSLANDLSNKNEPQHVWDHVIRCQNPNVQYHGSKEEKIHLSVRVPLEIPQSGTDSFRALYKFMCKNSCPSGMNRKPFEVVFTLEDERGAIHGRQKVNVRVCSCPKRDKEKEEKDYLREHDGCPPPGKKRKMTEKTDKKPLVTTVPPGNSVLDTKVYPINIGVCGKENQRLILQYAYDRIAGDIMCHGQNEHFKKCLENIATRLKNLD